MTTAGRSSVFWRSRPVFISSTFRDLHAERDYLRAHAFPELQDRLRERAHYLEVIDLRQGVEAATGDEEPREDSVLKVCLDEIGRSRPFFVGLLGDRYGWTPPPGRIAAAAHAAGFERDVEGRSITELEILFGVLDSPDEQRRSRFYFREMDYVGMPDAQRLEYDDRFIAEHPDTPAAERAAARDRVARLVDLKARITRQIPGRTRTFRIRWDARQAGLEMLSSMMVADLWSDLDIETREWLRQAPRTWREADARALDDFVDDRLRGFVERPSVSGHILEHALAPAGDGRAWGLVVTGEAGSGKSTLFAKVYRELRERDDVFVLAHAAGISVGAGRIDRLLHRWIGELAAFIGAENPLPDDERGGRSPQVERDRSDLDERDEADGPARGRTLSDRLDEAFATLLFEAASRRRIVVLFDALDQLENTVRAQYSTWLPGAWPAEGRFVATAVPGTASETLAGRPGVVPFPVPPVDREEAGEIARRFFRERHHRAVNERALGALLEKTRPDGEAAHGNPLWLSLAFQEMNLLEADDFERADRDFASLPRQCRMEALQVQEARGLPADAAGVYGRLLDRAEREFGTAWARAVVSIIALGRAGWRERDLQQLVPDAGGGAWEDLRFAGVRRALGPHVVQRGAEAQWDFFHAQLREAVLARNLADPEARRAHHARIAAYLLGLAEADALRVTETFLHLAGWGDQAAAAGYIATLTQDTKERANARATSAAMIETRQVSGSGVPMAGWTAGCLSSPEISTEQAVAVADFILTGVDEILEISRAAEVERATLLRAVRVRLDGVLIGNPNDARAAKMLSSSLLKLGDFHLRRGSREDAASALQNFHRALAVVLDVFERDPQDLQAARGVSLCFDRLGDLYERRGARGDAELALASYQRTVNYRLWLWEQNPADIQAAQDVSASFHDVGTLLWRRGAPGDADAALASYRQALDISRRLYELIPHDAEAATALAMSLDRLADFYLRRGAKGDLALALDSYERAVQTMRQLAERNPNDANVARNVSVELNKLGDCYLRLGRRGDAESALRIFQEAQQALRKLLERNPNDAQVARDLCSSLIRLGEFRLRRGERGDFESALGSYQEALAIRQWLFEQNPDDAEAARGVLVSLTKLADFCVQRGAQGDAGLALQSFQRALELAQQLLERNTGSAWAARDVEVSLAKLGDFYLRRGARGDADLAFGLYRQRYDLSRRVSEQNPEDAEAAQDVSESLIGLGDFYARRRADGDAESALASYTRALEIQQRLADRNPDDAVAARHVMVSLIKLGDYYRNRAARGDIDSAIDSFRRALETAQRLLDQNPNNALAARDVSVCLERLGHACRVRGAPGDSDVALASLQRAVDIDRRQLDQNPDDGEAAQDLAASLYKLGDLCVRRGHPGDARLALDYAGEAVEIGRRMYEQNPDDGSSARGLAVSYYKLAGAAQRAGEQALELSAFLQCLTLLQSMHDRGIAFDAQLQQVYEQLKEVLGGLGLPAPGDIGGMNRN